LRYGHRGKRRSLFLGTTAACVGSPLRDPLLTQSLRTGPTYVTRIRTDLEQCVGDRLSRGGAGILTCCPSTTPFGLALGPTYPGSICVAQETSGFRWAGFSPAFVLLIPTFSLPVAPPDLTVELRRNRNAPLPVRPCGRNPQLRYRA
jgi:hypothetical protein